MRKYIILLLAVIIFIPSIAYAQELPENITISADSAMLVDASTGEVLLEKNKDEQIMPASTSKLMTALITFEKTKLDDIVKTGEEVNRFTKNSSLAGIKKGESISVKDLLYGMMLASGNDAAAALAVHIGGSLEGFNDMMNARAKELGMENTTFINPHGLKVEDRVNYSTASDMAKLAVAVNNIPQLMEIISAKNYSIQPTNIVSDTRELKNTNILLVTPQSRPEYAKYKYEYATGMKTGLLENAADDISSYGCLVASANKDGVKLISLVFGDKSTSSLARWQNAIDMFEYGFNAISTVDLATYIPPVEVTKSLENCAKNDALDGQLTLVSKTDGITATKVLSKSTLENINNGSVQIEQEVVLTKPMVAPVALGEEMGYVIYKLNGEELCHVPLISSRKVYQLGEENLAKAELGLPNIDFKFEIWYLWFIIIPIGAFAGYYFIKHYGWRIGRRRHHNQHHHRNIAYERATSPESRKVVTYDYHTINENEKRRPTNYARKALRGRKF